SLYPYFGLHRDLHSFPTRRSSDLVEKTEPLAKLPRTTELKDRETRKDAERRQRQQRRQALYDEIHDLYEKTKSIRAVADRHRGRSEEHTSELQSRENLVCRLLLEK